MYLKYLRSLLPIPPLILLYLLSIFIISGIIPCAPLVRCFHTVFIIVFEHAHHGPKEKQVVLGHAYEEMQESRVKTCSPTTLEQHCMKVFSYFFSGFSATPPVMLWIRKWLTNLWKDQLSLKYLRHIVMNQVQLVYNK